MILHGAISTDYALIYEIYIYGWHSLKVVLMNDVLMFTKICLTALFHDYYHLQKSILPKAHVPAFNVSSPIVCSGKCYKQVVLTPMLEKRSHDSILDSLPHTVTLLSMPSAANGQRGFSVSVQRDVNGSANVQVKE